MVEAKRIKCSHCDTFIIADKSTSETNKRLYYPRGKYKYLEVSHQIIWCPNPDCQEVIFTLEINEGDLYKVGYNNDNLIGQWNLLPNESSLYINYPDFIPLSLKQDYQEACLIANLSPKASATLARRCLQGMIRDFWGINENNLFLEIEKLRDKIDIESYVAIHSMRAISNIGAHPDKDTSTIIDIEPDEAKELIYLIELLFNDWYISREEKRKRLEKIQQISASKKS